MEKADKLLSPDALQKPWSAQIAAIAALNEMTVGELAEAIGSTQPSLSRAMNGARGVGASLRRKIEDGTGVKVP